MTELEAARAEADALRARLAEIESAGHRAGFRLKDKIVGECVFKDDGRNVNPFANPASKAAWTAASAEMDARKARLVGTPAVLAEFGIGTPRLTVAAVLAHTLP